MRTVPKIVHIAVSTTSMSPLCGIVEIGTVDSTVKFELTEEIAHGICTDLERFLTQEQLPGSTDQRTCP